METFVLSSLTTNNFCLSEIPHARVKYLSASAGANQSAMLPPVQSRCASRANRITKDSAFVHRSRRGCSSKNKFSNLAAAEESISPTIENFTPINESSEPTLPARVGVEQWDDSGAGMLRCMTTGVGG